MITNYEFLVKKDVKLRERNPFYIQLSPLKKCICGHQPIIDASMALIHCTNCGLSFEYRYFKGLIPYYTWQEIHKGGEK